MEEKDINIQETTDTENRDSKKISYQKKCIEKIAKFCKTKKTVTNKRDMLLLASFVSAFISFMVTLFGLKTKKHSASFATGFFTAVSIMLCAISYVLRDLSKKQGKKIDTLENAVTELEEKIEDSEANM